MLAGFHSKYGLYFRREPDGTVLVMYEPFNDARNPIMMVALDPNTWASAVASMTARGENADTFAAALRFHATGNTGTIVVPQEAS